MTTMWIILGVAAAATLIWRFRRANTTLQRILREEQSPMQERLPAAHDR
jgi:hypothetical protein